MILRVKTNAKFWRSFEIKIEGFFFSCNINLKFWDLDNICFDVEISLSNVGYWVGGHSIDYLEVLIHVIITAVS